jgi:hypothetical protein
MESRHPNNLHVAGATDVALTHISNAATIFSPNQVLYSEHVRTLPAEPEQYPTTPLIVQSEYHGQQASNARFPSDPGLLPPFSKSHKSARSFDVPLSSRYRSSDEDDAAPLPMLPAPSLHITASVPRRDIKQWDRTSSLEFIDGEESVAKQVGGHVSGRRNGQGGRGVGARGNVPKNSRIDTRQHFADINLPLRLESILDPNISSRLQENAVVEVRLDAC